ncbi:hypothetical protein HPULCUR_003208 [Helicostylum pulchrum]|uniref:Uncharacterized protein n=1 Tax=Helicostylum pulchrum TaxID=562976 RepID=A0ABP9XUA7_9FUNG
MDGVHLMGNFVSQGDSESESDEEEEIEKEVEKEAEKEVDSRDIADSARRSARGSAGRSVINSTVASSVDSDSDLSLDAPGVLDCPDMLADIPLDDDEFDVGYICNYLETTFGSKEPDLNNNSNLSDPVTVDQNPQISNSTDIYKLSRKEKTKKQERVAERLEVEKLEVEQRVTETPAVEAESVEAEKLKAEKLNAHKLITEKLKAEKLKAEKRVPKKRVHIKKEYVVPKAVLQENPIPKKSIGSRDVIAQVVHGPRPKRTSRSETKKLYEERMKLENQSTETVDTIPESNSDQAKSNDVPHNADTNWTVETEVFPSKKARNSKVKKRPTNSSVEQIQVEQIQVEQSPVEHSTVDKNPAEQGPTAESLLEEKAPVQRKSRKPRTPVTKKTRSSSPVSNASRPRTPVASRTRSKSPVGKKVLDNIPVESIPTETNEETDVKELTSKTNSRAKKPAKKRPVKETPVEHIEEVGSIAPSTETTPIKTPKRRRPTASTEKKQSNNLVDEQAVQNSEKIITSTNLETTNVEPVEIEQAPSKKTKRSKNKREEPVKQIEKTVSQEQHIETVSSELTNTDTLLNQVDPYVFDEEIKEESSSELTNIANKLKDTEMALSEPTDAENISNKRIKSRKPRRTSVRKYTEEIPVEETSSSNEPTIQEIYVVEKPTKNAKLKKAYRNIPTGEEGTKEIEAEIPDVEETTPKETKSNKKTSKRKTPIEDDVSQETPTENSQGSVQKSNDELEVPTISHSSLENQGTKVVTEEKNTGDGAYSFEELLRRERERKKLAKLTKKNDKEKKKEAKAMRRNKESSAQKNLTPNRKAVVNVHKKRKL